MKTATIFIPENLVLVVLEIFFEFCFRTGFFGMTFQTECAVFLAWLVQLAFN